MSYTPRIKANPEYLMAVGQAFYNYTYLEWGIVYAIVKLSADGFDSVPKQQTASYIANALTKAIQATQPPLPAALRKRLVKLDEAYRKAISARNQLLHAHPYTASDGAPRLGGGGVDWPIDAVHVAAKLFEDTAIACNDIFHGDLKGVRP